MSRGDDGRPPIAAATDVRKVYRRGEPVEVLGGVSLTLERGSYTAIMGPSGSGKSTLMNLLGCLDRPSSGTVTVDGVDVTDLGDAARTRVRRETVGFVFQEFNLMPELTATENVALPLVFAGVDRGERRERASALLEKVGLSHRGDHRPSELSGGQRQRVAIARALANDPPLLLADEPTGSLDTETGDRIMAMFEALHDAGNAVLLVTHERPVAERAERIVHLLDGELERVEELDGPGPPDDGHRRGARGAATGDRRRRGDHGTGPGDERAAGDDGTRGGDDEGTGSDDEPAEGDEPWTS